jgi:hypothetical protein
MPHLKSCPTPTARRRPAAWWGGLALLAVAGCQDDAVEHYQVPKPPVYRLLGAIVPRKSSFWYFKLTGPDEAIKEQKAAFDRFLDSVTFTAEDKPPTWKLPEGWREGPADPRRFATLLLGPEDWPLELTVSALDRKDTTDEAAAVLANVNRWRRLLGVPEIDADRLPEIARPRDGHGVTFKVVEMTGPKPGKTPRGMGMAGAVHPPMPAPEPQRQPEGLEQPGLRYTTPPGWRETRSGSVNRVAGFQVSDGSEEATVTVTQFGNFGAMGDLTANVNRWRGDMHLPPVTAEQARREANALPVAGSPGSYVDLVDPSGKQRLLAVMVPRGNQILFFKMLGPSATVGRQKTAFEAFVQSVRFD